MAVALAAGCFERPARAQSGDTAVALSLFEQGRQLVHDGKFAEACPKLRASYEMVPKLGTLLNLADCLEKNGQTASAWARFTEAASMADRANEPERADFAKQHASALSAKVSKLVITLAAPGASVQIKRDGEAVPAAVLGVAMPVDPGKHTIQASAQGKLPWEVTIDVSGPGTTQTLQVPALQDAPVAAPSPAPPPAASAAPAAAPPPAAAAPPPATLEPSASDRGSAQKTWGLVVGAAGLASVGASLVLGSMAESAYGQSNQDGCVNNVCPQSGLDQRNNAYGLANGATYLAIAGAVLVAGGVVLFVTAPSAPERPRSALWIAPGPGSATLGGTW
jgi:hypothetical protein